MSKNRFAKMGAKVREEIAAEKAREKKHLGWLELIASTPEDEKVALVINNKSVLSILLMPEVLRAGLFTAEQLSELAEHHVDFMKNSAFSHLFEYDNSSPVNQKIESHIINK